MDNKPYISIIMPTMRIGGLGVVFDSLEKQEFRDFELVIADNIYEYRKDIVKEKAKQYSYDK
jgi:glycosyltransferase involved in cell wall biosynthesis